MGNHEMPIHHNTSKPPPPTAAHNTSGGGGGGGTHTHHRTLHHMTFFWSHHAELLFSSWPGKSSAMYGLALIFVFVLAVTVEWLSHCNFVKFGSNRIGSGLFRTGLYGVRWGLSYMVILAVMSYNGGIFLAAVLGHAIGFMLFGSRVFKKGSGKPTDLPGMKG